MITYIDDIRKIARKACYTVTRCRISLFVFSLLAGLLIVASASCIAIRYPVQVPVSVKGAQGVGSIHFELAYDSEILRVESVQAGELIGDALVDYSFDTPGYIMVGIASATGISGDGDLINIKFKYSKKPADVSIFNIANIAVYDLNTLAEVYCVATEGSFARDKTVISPVLLCGE